MAKKIPSENNTNQEDFEFFQKECLRWVELLSLHDWSFTFLHEEQENIDGYVLAATNFVFDGSRTASISLSKQWGTVEVTKDMLSQSAQDEVLHVLLAELLTHTKDNPKIRSIEHGIIHRIIHMSKKLKEEV